MSDSRLLVGDFEGVALPRLLWFDCRECGQEWETPEDHPCPAECPECKADGQPTRESQLKPRGNTMSDNRPPMGVVRTIVFKGYTLRELNWGGWQIMSGDTVLESATSESEAKDKVNAILAANK